MGRLFIFFITLSSILSADKVVVKTLACPELKMIQNSVKYSDDIIALNKYAVVNNCKVISSSDVIEAIDYDAANEKSIYIKILLKSSGDVLYVKREHILIEQPGKRNNFRF